MLDRFGTLCKEVTVLLDLPIFLASPTTILSTPGGKPALRPSSASARAVSGVASAGFSMTCNSTQRSGTDTRREEDEEDAHLQLL